MVSRYIVFGCLHVRLLNRFVVKDADGIYRSNNFVSKEVQVHVGFDTEDESTRAWERTHIKLEAFPDITDILNHIRKDNGCLGAQHDWFKEVCPPHPCVCIILSR